MRAWCTARAECRGGTEGREAERWGGAEEVILPAGGDEAVQFFEDAPGEPPYPPVARSQVRDAEDGSQWSTGRTRCHCR